MNYRRQTEYRLIAMKATGKLMLAMTLCACMKAEQVKWMPPAPQSTNSLGALTVSGKTLLSPTIRANAGALVAKDARYDDSGKLQITYVMGQTSVHVTVSVSSREDVFEATMDADQPLISSVDLGSWSPDLQPHSIPVPYYTGSISYLPSIAAYGNAWWDWHTTHATRLTGTTAQYFTRTDSTVAPFHEQLLLALSPDVDAVLPSPERP